MSFGPIPPANAVTTATIMTAVSVQEVATTTSSADAPDAASLRVALSMIDDWDHEFSSLFELEVATKTTTTGGRKAPTTTSRSQRVAVTAAPYKLRRGDTRKQEAQELRAEIEQLQRVIDSEKSKFITPKCEDTIEAVALRDEWDKMTIRQETQRFAAQVENEKLRTLLESQRRGAHKIVQLAHRVALLEQVLPRNVDAPFEHYQGPHEDPQVQLQRLVDTEREVSRVFSSGAFAKDDRPCFREVQFRDRSPDGGDGIEITFEMAWVLPFDVDAVAEALWIQSTRITSKDKTAEWMDLYEDATTIVSQYISLPTSMENGVINHGQIASRRLPKNVQEDSITFISNHQGRAFEQKQRNLLCKGDGNGDAWIRIARVASHQPTARVPSPLTQVQWSRRFTVCPPAYDCMTPQERTQWINTVIAGPMRGRVESNLEWNVQAVENILLASKSQNAGS